ncbi:hypothetical protein [Pseudovibrio sp. Ad26]|uniref:hypothetical protein n=1 Tax=Pseudovibrio sp. Ad26 TaxID=989410 RepID=UPI0007B1A634|nr:hypothetical protein [Pseudovibrio sp. Ad26]KZL13854.1 hypothetical protein PsAD26_01319 [Pseudovibrio sp. Ad26]
MLFNNTKYGNLTKEYVNIRNGLELHQFKWLLSDDDIGALPLEWNHLVGVYEKNPNAALIHYTIGEPYFSTYENTDWLKYKQQMLFAVDEEPANVA